MSGGRDNMPKNQKSPVSDANMACTRIRLDRRKKYGDSWKDNKEYQMMALVKEKVGRLEHNFENPTDKSYETKEDTLIDLVNWSLFYLQNLKDGKYK